MAKGWGCEGNGSNEETEAASATGTGTGLGAGRGRGRADLLIQLGERSRGEDKRKELDYTKLPSYMCEHCNTSSLGRRSR